MIKNKRGEISITILVIGVLIVCSLAMFTFFVSDFNVTNSFSSVGTMQKINSALSEYYFYQNIGMSKANAQGIFTQNILNEKGIKYMSFQQNASGIFTQGNTLLFSVKYPLS